MMIYSAQKNHVQLQNMTLSVIWYSMGLLNEFSRGCQEFMLTTLFQDQDLKNAMKTDGRLFITVNLSKEDGEALIKLACYKSMNKSFRIHWNEQTSKVMKACWNGITEVAYRDFQAPENIDVLR